MYKYINIVLVKSIILLWYNINYNNIRHIYTFIKKIKSNLLKEFFRKYLLKNIFNKYSFTYNYKEI